jgi:hypothetical protein
MVLQPAETNVAEILALLKVCLGEKPGQRREAVFWDWKHQANPFGPSLLLAAREEQQLAGLRAFLRWEWQADGKIHKTIRAVDTATHPVFQLRGIFSSLTMAGLGEARQQGIDFVFNTPNPNSMPGYLKMSWQHVNRLPMYVRLLRPLRFVCGLMKAKAMGQSDGAVPDQASFFRHAPLGVLEFLEAVPALDRLIARDLTLRGAGFTTFRSTGFCRWRYGEHPFVPYYVETVQNGGELKGVLIDRTNIRFGLREIMITDMLLAEDSPAIVAQLLESLRRRVRADYLIAHFGESSEHLKQLRCCGFFKLPGQGMNFTVRLLDRVISPDPLQAGHWSLCLGDLEIF